MKLPSNPCYGGYKNGREDSIRAAFLGLRVFLVLLHNAGELRASEIRRIAASPDLETAKDVGQVPAVRECLTGSASAHVRDAFFRRRRRKPEIER